MAGKGAAKRANAKRAREKQLRKKAAKKAAKAGEPTDTAASAIPAITENDLLAFQLSHFGDDTKPETWFLDADLALSYDPELDAYEEEEDELGYYEDGVKRTLTDEQIEMFRHSEIEQLVREGKMAKPESGNSERQHELVAIDENGMNSPASEASSIEAELMMTTESKTSTASARVTHGERSKSFRSTTPASIADNRPDREVSIPYDQRHKRKWEDYIDSNDPLHGSMTHRRMARELDQQRDESIELDY